MHGFSQVIEDRAFEKGIEKGIKRGIEKEKMETILSMYENDISIGLIAKCTRITENNVRSILQNENVLHNNPSNKMDLF